MRTASTKSNHARKILSFYRVNFSFDPPYKVLCDSETIALSLKHNLYLKDSLPKLLGSTAYVVVTECVLRELRDKGKDYSNAAVFARRVERVPCVHNGKLSGAECIAARMRKQQADLQLVLATNDPAILSALRDVPGVPLVSVVNNAKLVLKPPPPVTLDFVRRREANKVSIISAADRALLEQVRAEKKAATQGPTRKQPPKKKAKGPNPLSMKKSKKNPDPQKQSKSVPGGSENADGQENGETEDGEGDSSKRRRRRKRKRTRTSAKTESHDKVPEQSDNAETGHDEQLKDLIEKGSSEPPSKRQRVGVNEETEKEANSKPVEEKHKQDASGREPALTEAGEPSHETSLGLPQQNQLEKELMLPEHNKQEEDTDDSTIPKQKQPKQNINIVTHESKDVVHPATTEREIAASVEAEIKKPNPPSQEDTTGNKEEITGATEENNVDCAETPAKKKQRKNRRRRPKKAQLGPPEQSAE